MLGTTRTERRAIQIRHRLTDSAARQLLAGLSRRARLDRPVRPHMLRHGTGTELAEAGVAIDVVQEILGHRSIESTRVYVHPSQRGCATRSSGWNSAPAPGPDLTKEKDDDQVSAGGHATDLNPDVRASDLVSLVDWVELRRRGWALRVRCSNRVATTLFRLSSLATVNCDQVVHHPGTGLCFRSSPPVWLEF